MRYYVGRRSVPGERRCDTLWDMQIHSVRLPDELVERLKRVAEREDRSVSYIMRRALEQYLAPLPKPSDWGKGKGGAGFVIKKDVLETPAPSLEEAKRLKAEDRALALDAQREEIARQVIPPKPSKVYACPEDRCPYMSTSPGSCVHHRTRKLVKA